MALPTIFFPLAVFGLSDYLLLFGLPTNTVTLMSILEAIFWKGRVYQGFKAR